MCLITFQVSEKHKGDNLPCDRYPVKVYILFTYLDELVCN